MAKGGSIGGEEAISTVLEVLPRKGGKLSWLSNIYAQLSDSGRRTKRGSRLKKVLQTRKWRLLRRSHTSNKKAL